MTKRIAVPEEHLSRYLLVGVGQERYNLYYLADESTDTKFVTEAIFREMQSDEQGYYNPLGSHLTHISAANVVTQSIIAHYCRKFGKTKHELGEFIGKEFTVSMKKPITLKDSVRCAIEVISEIEKIRGRYGDFRYSLNEGSFTGLVTGIIPRPQPV